MIESSAVLLADPLAYLVVPSQLVICFVHGCHFLQVLFKATIFKCFSETSHSSLIFQVLLLRNAVMVFERTLPLP